LKRLYGALSTDLRAAVYKAGGTTALTAFDKANDLAKGVAKKRDQLAKIVGLKGDVSAEKVVERFSQMAGARAGDMARLRMAREVIGDTQWGHIGAELVNRMGVNPQTNAFSGNRFMTEYGKMSDAGKKVLFGSAKQALDDIALVASKFQELEKLGNPSGTGRVNAVMAIITQPIATAGAIMAPVTTAATAGGVFAGLQTGRRLAWYLAKPAVAGKAGGLLKAYYGVESAFDKSARILAAREEALGRSIRAYAAAVARETGQSSDDIEAAITQQIKDIRGDGGQQ
jgi:hypothetical protein